MFSPYSPTEIAYLRGDLLGRLISLIFHSPYREALVRKNTMIPHIARALLLLAFLQNTSISVDAANHQEKAVAKALSYLQQSGREWKENRGCVSCHQIPPMLWAMSLAKEAGHDQFEQEGMSLADWNQWSTDVVNFVKPAQKETCDELEAMTGNIDTMAGLLLAIHATEGSPWRDRMAGHLVKEQTDDGTWNPCGQLPAQRRASNETRLATTLWVAVCLLKEGKPFRKDPINELLANVGRTQSTEILALRLLLSDSFSSLNPELALKDLLVAQNDDGGWGWLHGEPSDALGTSFAVYAIETFAGRSDQPEASKAAKRGADFLLSSQQPNGGWLVPGTKKAAKGRKTQTANDWGTAWAVIALLQSP